LRAASSISAQFEDVAVRDGGAGAGGGGAPAPDISATPPTMASAAKTAVAGRR
jgi:hypothetical protein